MPSVSIRFSKDDFIQTLSEPGYHPAVVHAVRHRLSDLSEKLNPVIQVTYHLPDQGPATDRVIDHFVVTGATVGDNQ